MRLIPKKTRTLVILAIILMVFLGYSLFEGKGFLRLNRMNAERDELRQRVHDLKEENGRLAEEIRLLGEDAETLEALGRVELGLVKPGETIFVLPEEPEQGP